jgi:two-component system, LytTR family, response regulator
MGMLSQKIRTLVVDDEPVARARMLSLLQSEPDIEIIGECQSGVEAI